MEEECTRVQSKKRLMTCTLISHVVTRGCLLHGHRFTRVDARISMKGTGMFDVT